MSSDTNKPNATLGIDKKRKPETEDDVEIVKKDYKKPRKLKQLTFKTQEDTTSVPFVIKKQPKSKATIEKCPPLGVEEVTRVLVMLERVISRQDTAQACIDKLLSLCLQEAPDDSSNEEGLPLKKP